VRQAAMDILVIFHRREFSVCLARCEGRKRRYQIVASHCLHDSQEVAAGLAPDVFDIERPKPLAIGIDREPIALGMETEAVSDGLHWWTHRVG
jgi:hypothetical protein